MSNPLMGKTASIKNLSSLRHMREFDLTYSTQGGRLTFKALNEKGTCALWEVISLMQESDTLESVLLTLKRKGFTVRKAR